MRTQLSLLTLLVAISGCSPPDLGTGFNSIDPQGRTEALVKAVSGDDRSSIPDLIEMLDSSDPAQRMLAIRALERMTGQTLGYDYAAREWSRREAADRWEAWWRRRLLDSGDADEKERQRVGGPRESDRSAPASASAGDDGS